jgi:hypothetical protein
MLELEFRAYRNCLNNVSIDWGLPRLGSRQFNMCALLFSKVTLEESDAN